MFNKINQNNLLRGEKAYTIYIYVSKNVCNKSHQFTYTYIIKRNTYVYINKTKQVKVMKREYGSTNSMSISLLCNHEMSNAKWLLKHLKTKILNDLYLSIRVQQLMYNSLICYSIHTSNNNITLFKLNSVRVYVSKTNVQQLSQ